MNNNHILTKVELQSKISVFIYPLGKAFEKQNKNN